MKAHYIRVSTVNQNTERQKEDKEIIMGASRYEDKISGSVPLKSRPEGRRLYQDVKSGKIKEIHVHSIDRLGRSTIDILNTIKEFTELGVNVVSKKEGFQTMIDGKENPTAKMLIGILSTLAEFELDIIKERTQEGRERGKAKGSYTGRAKGSGESIEVFLNKPTTKKVLRYLSQGFTLRMTAKLSECSLGTVQKVARIKEEKGI